MSLRIRPADLTTIRRHGEATYPEECCGLLLGTHTTEWNVVAEVRPLDNERDDSRHNRFLITPETMLKADRAARERGLDVVGFYHSHPDATAVPSEFDREHAWPTYSYIIVSVREGAAVELKSWTLADDRARFHPETIEATEAL